MAGTWKYEVGISLGIGQEVSDPSFFFGQDEKEKMLAFIDVCIENEYLVTVKKVG